MAEKLTEVDFQAFVDDPTCLWIQPVYKVRNAENHFEQVNKKNKDAFVKGQIEKRKEKISSLQKEILDLGGSL